MKVSDLFVQSLENEGVKYIFGVPGEENEDILFLIDELSIQFVPCRHEQGVAFITNVQGRLRMPAYDDELFGPASCIWVLH